MSRITSMSRVTMTAALAGALLAGVGAAAAQTAPTGQFGQRTAGGTYVPSSHDPGCAGLLCNPLPSVAGGGIARNPSDVAPPPPCQGLLCSMTPYSMQRPYTAAEAAEVERQRAAAQAQIAATPAPAAPVRRVRKHRKAVPKVAKVANKAAAPKAAPASAAARTPAPADDGVQSLR